MAVISRVADEGFFPYPLHDFPTDVYSVEGNKIDTSNFKGCFVYPFDADFIPLSAVLHVQAGREGQKINEKIVTKDDYLIIYNAKVKSARWDKYGGGMDWEPIIPTIGMTNRIVIDAETAYDISMQNIEKILDAELDFIDFELANAVLVMEV